MSTEYPKIETLFDRDPQTFKVIPGAYRNPVYPLINPWIWTEKIDGTNIRCVWTGGQLTFAGKTDEAQIQKPLQTWLQTHVSAERIAALFPTASEVVIYGEGCGAKIQKGGGDYSADQKLIVFDVKVDGRWWLSDENARDVCAKLDLEVVPVVGIFPLDVAVDLVRMGITSQCAERERKAEGLVGRPAHTLYDAKGHRVIVKLKTKDFAKER